MSYQEASVVVNSVPYSQITSGYYVVTTNGQYHSRAVLNLDDRMIVLGDPTDTAITAVRNTLEYIPAISVTITKV
jgi:hypothetical protein